MFKIIFLILLCIIFIISILVIRQPNTFRYARTQTINASPAKIFEQVNDMHKFNEWSPWAKLDPNAEVTYEGPQEGIGASFSWKGNREVGEGKATIIESVPHQLIKYRMDFLKPMKATHTAEFTFTPDGTQTIVSWSMYGENGIMGRIILIFMNCEKMVGDMFSKGLLNLKAKVEA